MVDLDTRRRTVLSAVAFTNLLSLACQVIWVRQLTFLFGSTAGVFASVLASFLLGLALGALAAGRRIDRAARPWRVLALLEIALGVYCLASLPIFGLGRQLYLALAPASLGPLPAGTAKALVVLLCTIVPTMAVGAVFPVAVRLYPGRPGELGRGLSVVYAWDTLGAAAGALLAGFVLVPVAGLTASTLLLGVMAVAWGLWILQLRDVPAQPIPPPRPPAAETNPPRAAKKAGRKGKSGRAEVPVPAAVALGPRQERAVLACFFATGAAALLLETGWNRFFYVLNGTSVGSLAVVLAGFLSGIGIGSLLMRRRIDRLRQPLVVVAYLDAAIAVGGVLVFRSATFFERAFLASLGSAGSFYVFELEVYLTLFAIVLAATLAMGANFPLVARLCSPSEDRRGAGAGRAFFANTLGAVLGAVAGEFVLLPRWGFGGLLQATVAIYAAAAFVFLGLAGAFRGAGRRHLAAAGGLLALAIVLSPPILPLALPLHAVYYHGLRNRTWETFEDVVLAMQPVHREQGFYGEVAVVRLDDYLLLKHNGKTDASTGPDDNYAQLLLGHLPLFFHPHPQEVLNIGLGGGATLRAVVHHREVGRVTQVELDPLVAAAARTDFREFNGAALEDPRVELAINDGRNFVDRAAGKWDVIISEPPNIWVAGVSGLFTQEFYRSAHAHLRPGGLLCQWLPLYELQRDDLRLALKTITSVFRYASFWTNGVDSLVLAADQPLRLDRRRLGAAVADPGVRRDLADLKIAPADLPAFLEKPQMDAGEVQTFVGNLSEVNVDDRPRLEFATARNLFEMVKN